MLKHRLGLRASRQCWATSCSSTSDYTCPNGSACDNNVSNATILNNSNKQQRHNLNRKSLDHSNIDSNHGNHRRACKQQDCN